MKMAKWVCLMLVGILAIGGSLTPPASAQVQPAPPPEAAPPPPPGPPPGIILSPPFQPTQGDIIGAGFLNVVYVPGKAIICSAGTITSGLIMLLTFGNAYHAAVDMFHEGCGGHWMLTPYDVAGRRTPDNDAY
ncbi:MAG TPA: hypothetical protein VEL75_09755 [Candidatus Methylomirabilis sp.]|nr:hypothetical protein [Candidatus Methylomirabilis sp.]